MVRDTCSDLGTSNELWRVMFASGKRAMTLDALDEAFGAGHIDAATMVCAPGSLTFARLGAIAGLDADQAAATEGDASFDVDLGARVAFYASVDLADDARAFRPRWSLRRLLAVPAALGAIAIIAAFAGQGIASSEALPVAPVSVGRAEIAAPPPVSKPAEPAAPARAASLPASAISPPLTPPQKKALAAKDKKIETSRNAKRAASAPQRSAAKKGSSPFTKGGNTHDPLNASL